MKSPYPSSIIKISNQNTALVILIIGFISSLLISSKLWCTSPLFPQAPLLISLSEHLSSTLFYLLIISCIALFYKPKLSAFFIIIIFILFILADQNRIQPWAYQYVLMSGALWFYSEKSTSNNPKFLNTWRLIIVSIYFWSGLHKFNLAFPIETLTWMTGRLLRAYPESLPFIVAMGFIAPFAECGIAIGLLFRKTRKISVIFAILMHLTILLAIGPFGINWNEVVWPWNLAMIAFLIILFWKNKDFTIKDLIPTKFFEYQFLVLILTLFMPVFHIFGYFPAYLSWSLYSNSTYTAEVQIPRARLKFLPKEILEATDLNFKFSEDFQVLQINKWAVKILGTPASPELAVYKEAHSFLCKTLNYPEDLNFKIYYYPQRYSLESKVIEWTCN